MKLYANKLNNLGQMNEFLETYNLLKLNHGEIGFLIRPITSMEIKTIIKNPLTKKIQDQMASLVNSTKHLKRN